MPITLPTLKTEATLAKYAGFTAKAIAADLNTPSVARTVDVPREAIARFLIGRGIQGAIDARIDYLIGKINAALASVSPPAKNGADEQALAKLYTATRVLADLPTVTMTDSAVATFVSNMLADLVAEGVMTNPQRTQLLALANGQVSRAQELFGEPVTEFHVAKALAS